MSQFFGCVSFNSGIDIAEVAMQMHESTSFFKGDAGGTYQTNEVFISNKFLFNSPESLQLTDICQNERYVLAASCRIDNRAELAAKILIAQAEVVSDHEYILAAYTHFREECVKHLLGDFSFVVWDKQEKALFMAKDHIGVKPLFYTYQHGVVFFASDLNAFLHVKSIKTEFSKSYLASTLYGDFILTSAGIQHTCYNEVLRVKPAHYLLFNKGSFKEVKYWVLNPVFPAKQKTKEEYYYEFHELFETAIRFRMRGIESFGVGLELSGGLDSSAIACMCNEVLGSEVRFFNNLHSYSLVQSTEGKAFHQDFHDEEPFQELVLEKIKLNKEKVFKLSKHPFESYQAELEYGREVHGGLSKVNFTWQKSIYEAMNKNNCRVKISGFAGDECMTDSGEWWLYDILYRTDLRRLFQELMLLNKRDYKSIAIYLYNRIFGYRIDKQTRKKTEDANYLRKLSEKDLLPTENTLNTKSYKDYLISKISRPYTSLRFETETLHALRFNAECRYPMADIRLLEFMLRLPSELVRPEENKRQFIRNALGDILPDAIRYRKDKSSAVVPYFKYKNAVFLNQLLARKPILKSDIVNIEKIEASLANPDKMKRESDVASLLTAIYIAAEISL